MDTVFRRLVRIFHPFLLRCPKSFHGCVTLERAILAEPQKRLWLSVSLALPKNDLRQPHDETNQIGGLGMLGRSLLCFVLPLVLSVVAFKTTSTFAQEGKGLPAKGTAQEERAVTSALKTIFSPRRAPPHRMMGLSQRTFLDLIEQSKRKLEVAFVIDATDSMEPALVGVRDALSQMMNDLELYKQNEVSYQMVIYRDSGSPSGEVTFPLDQHENAFTSDGEALLSAIQQLTTESGAPYFPELADYGIHQSLTQLPWSKEQDVSRWLFLFGDAPPFDPTFQEEQTGASRRFATDKLIALANASGVRINCVLCPTRAQDQKAYAKVLDQTRAFMNALGSGTGGLMLDLSYEDIRSAIIQAGAGEPVDFAPVGTISRAQVEQARAKGKDSQLPSGEPVSFVVLPHAPLEQMDFASDSLAAQLATELRLRIKSVPGLTVAEPRIVERRFHQLRRRPNYSGLRGNALLQALGRSLNADYVLWGDVNHSEGIRKAKAGLYDARTGDLVAQVERASSDSVGTDQLGSLLAGDMLSSSMPEAAHRQLAGHLAAVHDDVGLRNVVTRQISSGGAHDYLVAGLSALEMALAYPVGDAEGKAKLQDARQQLTQAAQADNTNALPHFLLANCLYNLAKQENQEGGDSKSLMKQFGRALRAAYRFRTTLPEGPLRLEIEADYAMLVRKKPGEALPLYQKLADSQSTTGPTDAARRAHWMLAGIYGGDWGVDAQFVDRAKAHERLIQILAHWPDSSEAVFIKRVLRWDDQEGETQFPHFPQENKELVEQIDRDV